MKDRKIIVIVLAASVLLNLITSVFFSGIAIYIVGILLWSFCGSIIFVLLRKEKIRLLNQDKEITRFATILSVSMILLQIIFGLFAGFGVNPVSANLLSLFILIPMVTANLLAIELTRLYLVKSMSKEKNSFNTILLVSLFCTLISVRSFGDLGGMGILIFAIETLLPLLALNLLATNLVFYSGFPSAYWLQRLKSKV